MLNERFANKLDNVDFQLKVYERYVQNRKTYEVDINNCIEESIDLNEDIEKELFQLSQKLNCTLNDLVNIILREKIIEIIGEDTGFKETISTIALEELLHLSIDNEELENEIFKEKMLIVDSVDFNNKVVLLPYSEYEELTIPLHKMKK